MRTQPLPARDRDERRLAISGFGAFTILKAEAGLHVLELPRERQGFARANVHVAVAPRTDASRTVEALEEEAGRALSGSPAPQTVVRRYRREPSPLVRDASGWPPAASTRSWPATSTCGRRGQASSRQHRRPSGRRTEEAAAAAASRA